MTKWQKRILLPLLAAVLLLNGTLFVVANASRLPPSIRAPVWEFTYNNLSLPSRNEPYGVYPNKSFGLTDSIAVVFYDDHEKHVVIIRPGGDDHRHAAMQGIYHLRVNAPNDREAARLLRKFLNEIGFKGSISTALTFAHGSEARPMLGRSPLRSDIFALLSEYRPKDGYPDLAFVSCSVAAGEAGRKYIQQVADCYDLRVSASEKDVDWYVASKWFKSDEGKRNFEFVPGNWWTATPHEKELKRYSEVFPE
jgi:hypothetical protein